MVVLIHLHHNSPPQTSFLSPLLFTTFKSCPVFFPSNDDILLKRFLLGIAQKEVGGFPIWAMTERKRCPRIFQGHLLLSRGELGDIGVVALLPVLVGALQYRLFLYCCGLQI